MYNFLSFYYFIQKHEKNITFPELGQAVEKDFSVSAFWIIKMFATTEWKSCLWNPGEALLYIGGIPPNTQFILLAQGKVLVRSEMLSSCLLPDTLPAPTFTFPATETLTGYSFVFNTVGELPTGEQQISPWNLTCSWFPLHLQTAWPPSQLTAAATLCSSPAGRMWLQHSAFSISPDLQIFLSPAGNSDARKWRPPPAQKWAKIRNLSQKSR